MKWLLVVETYSISGGGWFICFSIESLNEKLCNILLAHQCVSVKSESAYNKYTAVKKTNPF